MKDIGTGLREARERKGVTLRQVADATKLSVRTLQFIEQEAFDRLPGGIFTKGYLRAYATEVGVDPEAVVSAYLEKVPSARAPTAVVSEPEPRQTLDMVPVGRMLLVVAVVLAVAFTAYRSIRAPGDSPTTSSRLAVEAVTEPPATESVVSDGTPVAVPVRRGLYLDIQPTGTCWVSVMADGRQVIYRLLQLGERVTVMADAELVLRVGNPEAFAFVLNGVDGRPIGQPGRPMTVRITEDNYQTFLVGAAPDAGTVLTVASL